MDDHTTISTGLPRPGPHEEGEETGAQTQGSITEVASRRPPARTRRVLVNLYPLAAVLLSIFLWGLIIAAVRYFA